MLVGFLVLGIVFLVMDKCGDDARLQKLRGEYETHKNITKIIVQEAGRVIQEQDKKIGELDERIDFLNGIIEVKDEDLAELDDKVTDLEDEFETLKDKDEKIENLTKQVSVWKEKFGISQSIIKDKDKIIFSLSKKYEAQIWISESYKKMYETTLSDKKKLQQIVTAQDWQIGKLKLTSRAKTGMVVLIGAYLIYDIVK